MGGWRCSRLMKKGLILLLILLVPIGVLGADVTLDTGWSLLVTLSEGSLKATSSSASSHTHACIRATEGKSSGKWYWEITANAVNIPYVTFDPGICRNDLTTATDWYTHNSALVGGYLPDGQPDGGFWGFSINDNTPDAYADDDVIGIAMDVDAGKLWFSKNGVWLDSAAGTGDPETGANPSLTFVPGAWSWYAGWGTKYIGEITFNFGGSAFTGTKPSGFTSYDSADAISDNLSSVGYSGVGIN